MVVNSYYPFVAILNQDTQRNVSLAAVGNSLKLYKTFRRENWTRDTLSRSRKI